MEASEALAVLKGTVGRHLGETFGSAETDADGDFIVRARAGVVWVRPREWTDGRTLVRIWCIPNVGVDVDEELTRFLVTENGKLAFGRFQLDEDRSAVVFAHTLLGDFLNRAELAAAVGAVAATAEQYGDEIKARFGGRLFGEPAAAAVEPATLGSKKTVQRVFAFLAFVAAIAGAVYAYSLESSVWLSIFIAAMAIHIVGRGAADVVTDPHKIRRALYFLLLPLISAAILYLAYESWSKWWLAALLGVVGGVVANALVAPLLFPGVHHEEMADSAQRLAEQH